MMRVGHAWPRGHRGGGAPAGRAPGRVPMGWGRSRLGPVPWHGSRAAELFPAAVLHWFERCGQFPQWDAPRETTRLILANTD